MTTMKYENWDEVYELSFVRALYSNNALAIKVMCKEDEVIVPFATLTINLIGISNNLDENCAIINIDECKEIIKHLAKEGVAEYIGHSVKLGFCSYPCYRFSKEWLKSLDSM